METKCGKTRFFLSNELFDIDKKCNENGVFWDCSDLATLDENGYGRIVGRIKDMVIRGGENIYPREIEELLHGHPSVIEAHVKPPRCVGRFGPVFVIERVF